MNDKSKIAIRLEGGLGDHLLGNRFVHAIKEKYPKSELHFFSDTENNPKSIDILKDLFPSIYKNCTVVGKRVNPNYKISSIFGEETYTAHINNLPEETLKIIKSYDKFYDLHIDGLRWIKSDFDWLRYYYFFPKPEINLISPYKEPYIMAHLYARPDSPYNLEQWYTIALLNKLSETNKIVIVTMEEHKNYYSEVFYNKNITIDCSSNIIDIFKIASGCEAFIGIDSGVRYIPYHFSKPTFVFSKYCSEYGLVTPSHLIRWLIFQKNVFPIGFKMDFVAEILNNCIKNPANQIFPEYIKDIDSIVVDRKLKSIRI
jgi:ADP-heptose:LPS heptosyltransferase